jgi:hypothetical protein
MKGHAGLLAIVANIDTHLELLAHDRLNCRLYLLCQFGLVNYLASLLTEQQLSQPRRAWQTTDVRREHPCFTCMHNVPHRYRSCLI